MSDLENSDLGAHLFIAEKKGHLMPVPVTLHASAGHFRHQASNLKVSLANLSTDPAKLETAAPSR